MIGRFNFFWACILTLPFLCCSVHAQQMEERFEQLTTKDGLSHFHVTSILQDREGFMWFGTANGLNKYDGYSFTVYQYDPTHSKGGLKNNVINDLLETQTGELWVATGVGLHHVDKRTGKITPFLIESPIPEEGIFLNTINSLIEDRQGQLWVTTRSHISRFDPNTRRFTSYVTPDGGAYEVVEDNQGMFWVTTPKGLYQFNPQAKKFTLFSYKWPSSPLTLYKDASGIIWITAYPGFALYRFDPSSGHVRHYPLRQLGITGEYIHSNAILEESADELWIASFINESTCLFRLNKESGKVAPYSMNANLKTGLNATSAYSLYKDRIGTLWVGTNNGVNKLMRRPMRFNHAQIVNINPAIRLDKNAIPALCEDKQGKIWAVNTSGDLYQYDQQEVGLRAYPTPFTRRTFHGFTDLHADRSDTLWLTTMDSALYALTPDRQRFVRYPFEGNIYNNSMTEDNQGRIWVIGEEKIAFFDRRTETFTYYRHNPKDSTSFPYSTPYRIFATRKGMILIGTFDVGLFGLDPARGTFTRFGSSQNPAYRPLYQGIILSIYEDSSGIVWIGTRGEGLIRLDPHKGSVSGYTTKNGLPGNNINGIQPDGQGNLWLSTDRGLCRLEPASGKCRTYNESDGLQNANFNNTSLRTRSGHLLFGTNSGLVAFHPDSLADNKRIPPVYITALTVRGKKLVLAKDTIELSYEQNYLSFDYVALNFDSPEKNQYAYQLVGIDKGWTYSGSRRFTSYTNLDPGEYTFKVKASNNDGLWNEQGAILSIIIHPPWWQTTWAYGLYAIVFVSSIWGFIQFRSRQLIKENKILEHKVTIRTAEVVKQKEQIQEINEELSQQKEEIAAQRDQVTQTLTELQVTQAQLIQKEKMASLGELTAGIAHEIQNPLNFVNNFSEVSQELLAELKEEIVKEKKEDALAITDDLSQNLEKISHHGKRAENIVKGMLQHSRTSSGEKQPTDLNVLTEEYLRLAYHGLRAKEKDFSAEFQLETDPTLGKLEVVPQEIGRVLLNLFNNAFYATQQKKAQLNGQYNPQLMVSTKSIGDRVEIRVKDNGTGIPESIKSKIFQPFFTTKPTGEGTGLGLSLSYDIITKGHGGALIVESNEGEFTEFIIQLPFIT